MSILQNSEIYFAENQLPKWKAFLKLATWSKSALCWSRKLKSNFEDCKVFLKIAMLRNVSPSPLQFHYERSTQNLYYTSKHDKTFLGRVRKHTTQLFDQKMLRDNNYLLIANVIVTLFNTCIDIWLLNSATVVQYNFWHTSCKDFHSFLKNNKSPLRKISSTKMYQCINLVKEKGLKEDWWRKIIK